MDATRRSDGDREPSKEDAAAAAAVAVAVATPLSGIADAFEKLAGSLSGDRGRSGDGAALQLDALCDACAPVSVLFGCLGIAFKFAEMEFVSKVSNLVEASKKYCTLEKIIDVDVANRTVKKQGSHTRNLRRGQLLEGSSYHRLFSGLCTISLVGSPDSSLCRHVCPPVKGSASAKAQ
ncbi:hypothetical protein ACJRO7_012236 [Eucalyptus globulus]|uniref:Glycolipid transfer protein domain-containing protein n=1 Tax=Eucalyptus globulus TaxID=34317 RepID=A0ABD3LLD6_EUCGL